LPDHALSANPRVQAQLDRLSLLSPGADILGLDRISTLLDRIGQPHRQLPPVFHVAGTNGKGSTCAFLRAALEADGHRTHVYTSPHLVRFNERIRIAGRLVDDDVLADGLRDILDRADDVGASFFEVTTALAFRLFADYPADACVIEVGLGGRLDATNILEAPAICGIASLSLDHQAFLGNQLTGIGREKAGIAKPGVPIVTQSYARAVAAAVRDEIASRAGRMLEQRRDWDIALYRDETHYRDTTGHLTLARPTLPGVHQVHNLGLAIAMLRHQSAIAVSETALRAAPRWASWPARLQRLDDGPLIAQRPGEGAVWLDGGHNPAAGVALAAALAPILGKGGRVALITGMLANKDAAGFLKPLLPLASALLSVPVSHHEAHDAQSFATIAASHGVAHHHHETLQGAMQALAQSGWTGPVLICGSLYLAGEALAANGQPPV
jgi:dihydrofolate synthase/folylpolyglutamate synthase